MGTPNLHIGIVGACGRGLSFREGCAAAGVSIVAVCDTNAEGLAKAAGTLGAGKRYTDCEAMLDDAGLDAVIIGTPMPLHVPQSIAALERNIHVLSEVPAGVSLDECRRLVEACGRSKALYMMAENCCYSRTNVLIRELVRQGLFGEVYYAEGEYLHELKELNEVTRWRRTWQTGIAGVTYGTHSLGPILQWMPGDRVTRVCCEDAGPRYRDPRGEPYAQTTPVMLCKTARGALIKVRCDMVSNRPSVTTAFALQGTDGSYESSRAAGDRGRIWLRSLSREIRWLDPDGPHGLDGLAREHLPEAWRNPPPEALRAGHGGSDFFEILDFVNAVRGKAPCPIGIHEAMDMTLPGLVSQQSALDGGRWLNVPDSRVWAQGGPTPQLQMIWPEGKLAQPPQVAAPDGYRLRVYEARDEASYVDLIARAGFGAWDRRLLQDRQRPALPDGIFVVEHMADGAIVATAMAIHAPQEHHPAGGAISWVAADPAHRGRRLGAVVTAAATARLIRAGYRRIYLLTDDVRLPAIKTYLGLGFEPFLFCDGMAERWRNVRGQLKEPAVRPRTTS